MTNDESKEILSKINIAVSCGATPILSEKQIIEATNVAIKALDQQPCEDCISRAEALKTIRQIHPVDTEYDCTLYDKVDIMYVLNDLPSVTPQQTRWIPCSEKMPDINIHVLAQFFMGGMAECYYAHNWWHIVGGFRISGDEVIAWMPLPQPYAESEDKE